MADLFSGKVVLVTGGSHGIGRAIVERFAASGALVAFSHHPNDIDNAVSVVSGLSDASGSAFAIPAFLGPEGTAEALAEAFRREVRERLGEEVLDILVNNFGSSGYGRVPDTTYEYFEETVGKNLRLPFFLVKALLPSIRPGGSIINISSAAARLVNPDLQVYALAKAGQNKFTQNLAREVGPQGIRVNGIMPGFIDTVVNEPFLSVPENLKAVLENTALGRLGLPGDIANVTHALASPDFAFVTGQIIEVGGGYSM